MKTLFQKILLSAVFCLVMVSARGQWVTVTDSGFVDWMQMMHPLCMNGNQMDTTCSGIINSTYELVFGSNLLDATWIKYFDNLQRLEFSIGMPLTSLTVFPPLLKFLKIQYLSTFTTIENLPPLLDTLNCSYNSLDSLPTLPSTLKVLICTGNNITSIPNLPSGLLFLDCGANSIDSLPPLPGQLLTLNCPDNMLTSLPTLPQHLTSLSCHYNINLDSLPALPITLQDIECYYDGLITLPLLPDSLSLLNCHDNYLTSLPTLPSKISYLDCSNNMLTSLPSLPDAITVLSIDNNPINCLPPIKRITYRFDWGNTGITCLPNAIDADSANPLISSVPICDPYNTQGCQVYWNIGGKTFKDSTFNCVFDSSSDLRLNNLKIKLFQGGNLVQQSFTNSYGQYIFETDTGTYSYQIDTSGVPATIICPALNSYTSTISATNSIEYDKDFAIHCKPGFDIGVRNVIRKNGQIRPGFSSVINIAAGDMSNQYGLHCGSGQYAIINVTITGPATYLAPAPGALTPMVSGNLFNYLVADIGTLNFTNDLSFIINTDTNAIAGNQVCFNVSILPSPGDNNSADDTLTQCLTVRNSYDPNEKEVYPFGSIDTAQHDLTYTIYFQNTGNDTAQHIYILDTLDNAIDESSIQLLAYSHEPLVQVMGNVVKFNFPNINLPDSTTDEPHSHGYVQYRVRIKDGTVVGTQIHNTAYIIFDFNTPVVTNTTFNQIDLITDLTPGPSPKERGAVLVYPTPAKDFINFKLNYSSKFDLTITDLFGRTVYYQKIQNDFVSIPVSKIGEGIFIYRIETESKNVSVGKIGLMK